MAVYNELELDCTAMLNCLPTAAVVVDAAGLIAASNLAADQVLADQDGLSVCDGRLLVACAATHGELLRRLSEKTTDKADTVVLRIPRRSMRASWVLNIRSINDRRKRSTMRLISWLDPQSPPRLDWKLLPAIFGLSPTESKVVTYLALGHDLASVAQQLGIRQDTVRAHLKATFRKMGIHRQQELIQTATMLTLLG